MIKISFPIDCFWTGDEKDRVIRAMDRIETRWGIEQTQKKFSAVIGALCGVIAYKQLQKVLEWREELDSAALKPGDSIIWEGEARTFPDPYRDSPAPEVTPGAPEEIPCPMCGKLMVWDGDESVGWSYRLTCDSCDMTLDEILEKIR
jgi:hypothetical protein